MKVVEQNRAAGLAHRHSWRDRRVTSTWRGINIFERPAKRVLQVCNSCAATREVIRDETGAWAWLLDQWYGRR